MPALEPVPGIYRFAFHDAVSVSISHYIGESATMRRRMDDYSYPGNAPPTDARVRDLLLATLKNGGTARLSVVLDASFNNAPLNLTWKPARLLVENAAIIASATSGVKVQNL